MRLDMDQPSDHWKNEGLTPEASNPQPGLCDPPRNAVYVFVMSDNSLHTVSVKLCLPKVSNVSGGAAVRFVNYTYTSSSVMIPAQPGLRRFTVAIPSLDGGPRVRLKVTQEGYYVIPSSALFEPLEDIKRALVRAGLSGEMRDYMLLSIVPVFMLLAALQAINPWTKRIDDSTSIFFSLFILLYLASALVFYFCRTQYRRHHPLASLGKIAKAQGLPAPHDEGVEILIASDCFDGYEAAQRFQVLFLIKGVQLCGYVPLLPPWALRVSPNGRGHAFDNPRVTGSWTTGNYKRTAWAYRESPVTIQNSIARHIGKSVIMASRHTVQGIKFA